LLRWLIVFSADVYEVQNAEGESLVLKIHRCVRVAARSNVWLTLMWLLRSLGRVCFRKVKDKRDYLLHRKNASWLYLARLAALR
jgi:RIO kinase 2